MSDPDFIKHKETFESFKAVIHYYRYYKDFQRFRDTNGIGYFLKKEDPDHDDLIINVKHEGSEEVIALHVKVMPQNDRIKFYSKSSISLSA